MALAIDDATARPEATLLAVFLVLVWLVGIPLSHFSQDWISDGTAASNVPPLIMVFALQYAQSRNARALHAKADMILAALHDADNRFIGLEQREDHVVEEMHAAVRAQNPEL